MGESATQNFEIMQNVERGLELGSERCPGALDPAVLHHFSRRSRKSTRENPKSKIIEQIMNRFARVPRAGWLTNL